MSLALFTRAQRRPPHARPRARRWPSGYPALAEGVATWCVGSDVGNAFDTLYSTDPITGEETESIASRVVCTAETVMPADADVCDRIERRAYEDRKRREEAAKNRPNLPKFPGSIPKPGTPQHDMPKPLPLPRLVKKTGVYSDPRMESIAEFAVRYDTTESELDTALAPAAGREVILLDPSPYGRASFLWKDARGLTTTATVQRSGNIVTSKTAK